MSMTNYWFLYMKLVNIIIIILFYFKLKIRLFFDFCIEPLVTMGESKDIVIIIIF